MAGKNGKANKGNVTGERDKYSPEMVDRICHAVARGASLTAACQDEGLHSSTFYAWMDDASKGVTDKYARARAERGEHYGGKVAEVSQRCESGEIDPQAARVAIDGYKWTAARMAPKHWGDKSSVEMSGKVEVAHKLPDSLRRAMSSDPDLRERVLSELEGTNN